MMNGSESRIHPRIRYILVKISGILPDLLQQNLFILLSNVGSKANLDINKVFEFPIDKNKIVSYDNLLFALSPTDF
jgi:hypothetical protein